MVDWSSSGEAIQNAWQARRRMMRIASACSVLFTNTSLTLESSPLSLYIILPSHDTVLDNVETTDGGRNLRLPCRTAR